MHVKKEVSRFTATFDEGEIFTVIEWRSAHNIGTIAAPHAIKLGMPEFRTLGGDAVNQIDPETFEIIQSALVVRKN